MGQGAALSMETADVTLLDSKLEKIEYSIRLGKQVTAKIIQNVVFALAVKLLVLGFALAGTTQLWAAIASDVGAMLLVTLNAMLLLPRRQTHVDLENLKGDVEKGEAQLARTGLARESSGMIDLSANGVAKNVCVLPRSEPKTPVSLCKKGCCDMKTPTQSNCKNGDCELIASTENTCLKGCCEREHAFVSSEKCCCESKIHAATEYLCKNDCCEPKILSVAETLCEKGCCESKTLLQTEKSCKKGCCGPKLPPQTDSGCKIGCCEERQAASACKIGSSGVKLRSQIDDESKNGCFERKQMACDAVTTETECKTGCSHHCNNSQHLESVDPPTCHHSHPEHHSSEAKGTFSTGAHADHHAHDHHDHVNKCEVMTIDQVSHSHDHQGEQDSRSVHREGKLESPTNHTHSHDHTHRTVDASQGLHHSREHANSCHDDHDNHSKQHAKNCHDDHNHHSNQHRNMCDHDSDHHSKNHTNKCDDDHNHHSEEHTSNSHHGHVQHAHQHTNNCHHSHDHHFHGSRAEITGDDDTQLCIHSHEHNAHDHH
jgi:hypothetical protein